MPVEKIEDPNLRMILRALRDAVDHLTGQRGQKKNRPPTNQELMDAGVLGMDDAEHLYNPNAAAAAALADFIKDTETSPFGSAVLELDATNGLAEATYSLGTKYRLPKDARIWFAGYEVITTFTSNTDAATISLGIETDDAAGIVAAIAISDVSNPWDAGMHDTIQTGSAANMSELTTGNRHIQAVVAGGEDLSAGKLRLFFTYFHLARTS